jgi:hypothetical protein
MKDNFINWWKEKGFNEAFKKLKYNFIMLETPEQILKIELISYFGMIFGIIFAIVFLIYFKMWYVTIAAMFSLLLQYAGMKHKWQQLQQLKDIQNLYGGGKENGV